jgi:hypothetical protein
LAIISNLKKELGGKCIMSNIADTRGLFGNLITERERDVGLWHIAWGCDNFSCCAHKKSQGLLSSKGCGFYHNMLMMTGMCCMKCLQWTMYPKCLQRERERFNIVIFF